MEVIGVLFPLRDSKVIWPYLADACHIEEEIVAVGCRMDEMRKLRWNKTGI